MCQSRRISYKSVEWKKETTSPFAAMTDLPTMKSQETAPRMSYKPCQIFRRRIVQKELGESLRFIKRAMYKKQVGRRAANASLRPLPKSCALKRTHGRHTTYGAGRSYMETSLNRGLARIHVRLAQIRVWLERVTTLTRRQRL